MFVIVLNIYQHFLTGNVGNGWPCGNGISGGQGLEDVVKKPAAKVGAGYTGVIRW